MRFYHLQPSEFRRLTVAEHRLLVDYMERWIEEERRAVG
jgi:hypothetical protein